MAVPPVSLVRSFNLADLVKEESLAAAHAVSDVIVKEENAPRLEREYQRLLQAYQGSMGSSHPSGVEYHQLCEFIKQNPQFNLPASQWRLPDTPATQEKKNLFGWS